MKTNYHTHTTWCDGKDSPETVVLAAIEKGFGAIGFSSHAMLPEDDTSWVLTPEKAPRYAAEIRTLAKKYEGRIRILCGVEADYVPGGATPDRRAYAAISPDYIIGSVHFVVAPDGARVSVDESPESLADGIRRHFGGDAEAYLHAYFAQVREMLLSCDFDVVGHLDLVRKFNCAQVQYAPSVLRRNRAMVSRRTRPDGGRRVGEREDRRSQHGRDLARLA